MFPTRSNGDPGDPGFPKSKNFRGVSSDASDAMRKKAVAEVAATRLTLLRGRGLSSESDAKHDWVRLFIVLTYGFSGAVCNFAVPGTLPLGFHRYMQVWDEIVGWAARDGRGSATLA